MNLFMFYNAQTLFSSENLSEEAQPAVQKHFLGVSLPRPPKQTTV